MSSKTILVLGGGAGGLVTSNVLTDKLGNRATVRLVERKKQFEFPPSYSWHMQKALFEKYWMRHWF